MRAGFRLRLGLDSIIMAWGLIERRVLVGSRLRLSLGLASIMNKLIMMVWGFQTNVGFETLVGFC